MITVVVAIFTLVCIAVRGTHAISILCVSFVAFARVTKALVDAVSVNRTSFCCASVRITTCVSVSKESIVTRAFKSTAQVSACGMCITLITILTLVFVTCRNTAAQLLDEAIITLARVPGTLILAAGIKRAYERIHCTLVHVTTRCEAIAGESLSTDALVSNGQINTIRICCTCSFTISALVCIPHLLTFTMLEDESINTLALVTKTLVDAL